MDDPLVTPRYTAAEAASLLDISRAKVSRWARGAEAQPVISSGSQSDLLSFATLIELRYANEFLREGLSIYRVRKVFEEFSKRFPNDPAAILNQRLLVTCNEVFLPIFEKNDQGEGERKIVSLVKPGQYGITQVIDAVAKELRLVGERVVAWYPQGPQTLVVVDPTHGYGSPTIVGTNLRTRNLFAAFQADRDIKTVAEEYGIEPAQVQAAVWFETRRAA